MPPTCCQRGTHKIRLHNTRGCGTIGLHPVRTRLCTAVLGCVRHTALPPPAMLTQPCGLPCRPLLTAPLQGRWSSATASALPAPTWMPPTRPASARSTSTAMATPARPARQAAVLLSVSKCCPTSSIVLPAKTVAARQHAVHMSSAVIRSLARPKNAMAARFLVGWRLGLA